MIPSVWAVLGLPALWPQATLAAAALFTLGAGMFPGFSRPALRLVTVAALLAAVFQLRLAAPGLAGHPLISLDGLGLAWQGLFCLGALPAALLLDWDDEVPPALLLGSVLGMGLLAASGNLLLLFIGLEFMSLPAYSLVARPGPRGERASLEAAVKYFFAGGLAGALFLLGMALHYHQTGSLLLVRAVDGPLERAAVALMGAAALFKVGAFPLHFWLPDVYESTQSDLAGFLSTSMKAAGVFLLLRIASILPASPLAAALPWMGAATALFGALLALRQTRLQRLLAYSSISHAGNLVLGVGAWAAQGAMPEAAAPVFFYLTAYLFMSNGIFVFLKAAGVAEWNDLKGLGARNPGAAAGAAALAFCLAGIPPTGGFFAKFFVWWEAVKAGLYFPAAVAALASLTALGYYLGMVREMWLEPASAGAARGDDSDEFSPERAVVWACAAGAVLLGLAPWIFKGLLGRIL